MPNDSLFAHLREIIVYLAAASLVIPLFHRRKISPVIGYLLLGFVIGPFGLELIAGDVPLLSALVISDLEGVKLLAEFGIVFLLFKIGLELSLTRMWAMRRLVLGLGGSQYALTAVAVAIIAVVYGNNLTTAIILGGALAMSSTAIIMQLLYESKLTATPMGRACFSILLMQDLAVAPLLAILGVFAAGDVGFGSGLLLAAAKGAVAIAVILILGRVVLGPLFRHVSATQSPELLVAITLLTVIGTAVATAAAGLSMALGAFLSGLLLSESEFQHQIETDIEPFKGLLLGLFFFSVGMTIDLRVLGQTPGMIAVAVAGLFALKGAIIAPAAKAFGLSTPAAVEMALIMGGAGEFGLVAIDLALNGRILPPDVGQFMLLVAGLSMILTPLAVPVARTLARAIEIYRGEGAADLRIRLGELEGHVIVAGFGRVGEAVARLLEAEHIPYVAFDRDIGVVTRHRAHSRMIYLGDAARYDLLHRARAETALALIVTLDDPHVAEAIVRQLRRVWPRLPVFARARDAAHATGLMKAGATYVVPETVEASLQLGGRVLASLGVPETAINARLDREREQIASGLVERI